MGSPRIIGVSLSEPHTSMTALLDVSVCLRVGVYRKFKLSEGFQICTRTKTNSCSMKARLQTMADKGRLLTDGTVKSRTVVEFASGKGNA